MVNREVEFDRLPTYSSGLSNRLLLFFGLGPRRWRELLDLRDFRGGQTGEQVFQIIEWIDSVPPATAQQRVDRSR